MLDKSESEGRGSTKDTSGGMQEWRDARVGDASMGDARVRGCKSERCNNGGMQEWWDARMGGCKSGGKLRVGGSQEWGIQEWWKGDSGRK